MFNALTRSTLHLYGKSTSEADARYRLFSSRTSYEKNLPPRGLSPSAFNEGQLLSSNTAVENSTINGAPQIPQTMSGVKMMIRFLGNVFLMSKELFLGSLSNGPVAHAKRVCTSLCGCVECSNEMTDEIEDGNQLDGDDEL